MKKMIIRAALVLLTLSAGSAFAVKKGETLYIKTPDTKLLKEAKAGAAEVTKLKAGTAVIWNGADPKDKQFHQVEAGGKKGVVLQANLSPNKPADEVVGSDGKPISAQAFAGSGAATKALTEAGVKYAAEKGPTGKEAAAQVIYVEEHSKTNGDAALIQKHRVAAGLEGGKK